MRTNITRTIALALLALTLSAEEPKPAPTVEQLQAKVVALDAEIARTKAQLEKASTGLKKLQLRFQYEAQICSLPEMAKAILEDAEADAKVKALPKEPKQ